MRLTKMAISNPPNKTSILLVIMLGQFVSPFLANALNIALPQIGTDLNMDAISLGWVVAAFMLASTMFIIPFGRLSDIWGTKKMYILGISGIAATSLLLALSSSSIMLIAMQFLQGAMGAMIFATGAAILTSAFPPGERGKALGMSAAAVYLGLSLGPFLGGLLTHNFGWRSIFIPGILLGIITVVLISWKLKGNWTKSSREKLDTRGFVVYSLTLVAFTYGFTHIVESYGPVLVVLGLLGFIGFVLMERRTTSPLVNLDLFTGNRVFSFSCLAALINYGATFCVSFLLSLYLQYIKGFSPQDAGFIMVVQPVVQVIFAPIAGRLSDKIQPRFVSSAGMAIVLIGLLPFTLLDQTTSILFIMISLGLIGFGLALFVSPNINAVMSSVDKRFYGVASATVATTRHFGMILNMGIVMLLFALYMGNVQITPEYHESFLKSLHTVFIISAVLCFFGIFASLVKGKPKTTS
jgi:EmrB/QacA subfamily drug resistance transporter